MQLRKIRHAQIRRRQEGAWGTNRSQSAAIGPAPSPQTRKQVLARVGLAGPFPCAPSCQATVLLVRRPSPSVGKPTSCIWLPAAETDSSVEIRWSFRWREVCLTTSPLARVRMNMQHRADVRHAGQLLALHQPDESPGRTHRDRVTGRAN